MDLEAVRTVVAVAESGQFQRAAAALSLTQQAVSKRILGLERELGVTLFRRTPQGAVPTIDGQAFLPHARELLRAADRALAAVRPDRRPLRVDVVGRRAGAGVLLHDFHRARPELALDVVALIAIDEALTAVRDGTIDASFRAVIDPAALPADLAASAALDEPLELLTGPRHALADAEAVTPHDLRGHRIWIPGIVPGSEWGAYYDALGQAFGLTIDGLGPNFGTEPLLDALADAPELATLVGPRSRLLWPAGHDLRRIPVRNPMPVYPHALVRRRDNRHPGLDALRRFLDGAREPPPAGGVWRPAGWA
ncbi:LysR family transcriptional regulator [Patulibacter defluvii]|uniref:LysR family transcriptional regulator n=1 Tax=Patulibacter defluvii TaxID=3095358 RepID=UPI002A76010C|nr:LysR family transcriptional regulator [Patulibacter sp. DM4]